MNTKYCLLKKKTVCVHLMIINQQTVYSIIYRASMTVSIIHSDWLGCLRTTFPVFHSSCLTSPPWPPSWFLQTLHHPAGCPSLDPVLVYTNEPQALLENKPKLQQEAVINRYVLYFWNGKYYMWCWFSATFSNPQLLIAVSVQVSLSSCHKSCGEVKRVVGIYVGLSLLSWNDLL